ncbi:MAG: hypothetical protein R3F46_06365 [bacterium]
MRSIFNILFLIICFFSIALPAFAKEPPAGYPGNYVNRDGQEVLGMNIALLLVQEGVYAYHYAMGEWPASWADVVDAGFCQVDLVSPEGQSINPDDGNIDFTWDVVYVPSNDYYDPPKNVTLIDKGGPSTSLQPYVENNTFQEVVAGLSPDDAEHYVGLINNVDWRKLAAIRRYCNRMMMYDQMIHGAWPEWSDFYESAWSPIDSKSINPLTNMQFRIDGSPNDFAIMTVNQQGRQSVQLTDSNGEVSLVFAP